jgi:hypothetical protein
LFRGSINSSCSKNGNEVKPFALDLNGEAVKIEPSPGNMFYKPEGESSYVFLKDVSIATGIAEKDYYVPKVELPNTFRKGETIIVVKGIVQNKHPEYHEIAMGAQGFDSNGKQVCWTLDPFGPGGLIELFLEQEQEGEFTLHLNFSEYIDSVRIYASVSKLPAP